MKYLSEFLTWLIFVVALIAAVSALYVSPAKSAEATLQCGTHLDITTRLREEFGEVRAGVGVSVAGNLLELYVHPETREWSVIVTNPNNGATCLKAAGEDWRGVMPKVVGMVS